MAKAENKEIEENADLSENDENVESKKDRFLRKSVLNSILLIKENLKEIRDSILNDELEPITIKRILDEFVNQTNEIIQQ